MAWANLQTFVARASAALSCLAALHALKRAGARLALVGARGDDAYPVPRRLYFGLGFSAYARTEAYVRPRVG
jgi:hypothetical protein